MSNFFLFGAHKWIFARSFCSNSFAMAEVLPKTYSMLNALQDSGRRWTLLQIYRKIDDQRICKIILLFGLSKFIRASFQPADASHSSFLKNCSQTSLTEILHRWYLQSTMQEKIHEVDKERNFQENWFADFNLSYEWFDIIIWTVMMISNQARLSRA